MTKVATLQAKVGNNIFTDKDTTDIITIKTLKKYDLIKADVDTIITAITVDDLMNIANGALAIANDNWDAPWDMDTHFVIKKMDDKLVKVKFIHGYRFK